jgi:hypothetical protein
MARENNDRLNRVLREWLDRADDGADREALRRRIAQAVDGMTSMADSGNATDRWRRRTSRTIYAAVAVAAALLVVVLWPFRNARQPEPLPRGDDPAQELLAKLDVDELQRRLALLDQLDDLFENRWEWMVECGDRVDMHVSSEPIRGVSSESVAVRLAVLVRDHPAEPFRVQEKTFVLTRAEQPVEAVLEDGVSRKLYFWVFPIDDGLFTYDVDLQTTEPRKLSIRTSGAVASGRPTKILSFEQDGREYRVYLLLVPGKPAASDKTRQV